MKSGDADEFIDYLMDGGASVRHKGYVYHFSGFVYHPGPAQVAGEHRKIPLDKRTV